MVVYTLWLKRTTPQNIVIGGAAGAIPALSGWAAANGHLGLGAVFLFAIVLLWTPPHFWALALLLERQYAAAQIPMMPVVRGARETARQVLAYSIALGRGDAASPVRSARSVPCTWRAAVALGAAFVALAWRLWREPDARPRRRPVPLLAALSRAAVRRGRARCGVALNPAGTRRRGRAYRTAASPEPAAAEVSRTGLRRR